MKGMKRASLTLLLCLLIAFSIAAAPSVADVRVAVNAITDASISAIAAFLNTPTLTLSGLTIHQKPGESLPTEITFDDADVGGFRSTFRSLQPQRANFFSSLLSSARGPLNELALQFLDLHEWERGQARLTGKASTEWGAGLTLTSLMTKAVTGAPLDPITVDADVLVTGTSLSTAVHIDGVFMIESTQEGVIRIRLLSLKINGMAVETP